MSRMKKETEIHRRDWPEEYWKIYHKAKGDSPYVVLDRSEWDHVADLVELLMYESCDGANEAALWRGIWEDFGRSWWVRLGLKLRLLWLKPPINKGEEPW